MIVKIFTGPLNYSVSKVYQKDESEYIIGVDQGCTLLLKENMLIDLALGDFDSIEESQMREVEKYSKEVSYHEKAKDYTDTFLAVKKALELNPDEIIIYGGLGKRFDHTFANLNILKLGNITIKTDDTEMFLLDPGTYKVSNDFKYISFFALEDVVGLTLNGFKFEVDDILLDTENPLCISNEGSGVVEFKEGLLLVIKVNE